MTHPSHNLPWTFGPIPPGAPLSPSYAESVRIAVTNAIGWINNYPKQTFALGGYSQGAEAASRVLAEIMTGSLQWARPNLIGGYTFGNPWRLTGHTFPGGTDPGGRGSGLATGMPTSHDDYIETCGAHGAGRPGRAATGVAASAAPHPLAERPGNVKALAFHVKHRL